MPATIRWQATSGDGRNTHAPERMEFTPCHQSRERSQDQASLCVDPEPCALLSKPGADFQSLADCARCHPRDKEMCPAFGIRARGSMKLENSPYMLFAYLGQTRNPTGPYSQTDVQTAIRSRPTGSKMVTTRARRYPSSDGSQTRRARPSRSGSNSLLGQNSPPSALVSLFPALGLMSASALSGLGEAGDGTWRSGAPSPESHVRSAVILRSPRSPSPASSGYGPSTTTSDWSAPSDMPSGVSIPSALPSPLWHSAPEPHESRLPTDAAPQDGIPTDFPWMDDAVSRSPTPPVEPSPQRRPRICPGGPGAVSRLPHQGRTQTSSFPVARGRDRPDQPGMGPGWAKIGGGFYYAAGPTIPRQWTWREIWREIVGCIVP